MHNRFPLCRMHCALRVFLEDFVRTQFFDEVQGQLNEKIISATTGKW